MFDVQPCMEEDSHVHQYFQLGFNFNHQVIPWKFDSQTLHSDRLWLEMVSPFP